MVVIFIMKVSISYLFNVFQNATKCRDREQQKLEKQGRDDSIKRSVYNPYCCISFSIIQSSGNHTPGIEHLGRLHQLVLKTHSKAACIM